MNFLFYDYAYGICYGTEMGKLFRAYSICFVSSCFYMSVLVPEDIIVIGIICYH